MYCLFYYVLFLVRHPVSQNTFIFGSIILYCNILSNKYINLLFCLRFDTVLRNDLYGFVFFFEEWNISQNQLSYNLTKTRI